MNKMLERIVAVARSYPDWMNAFCQRKFNSDFAREMTRSVAEYIKDFTE